MWTALSALALALLAGLAVLSAVLARRRSSARQPWLKRLGPLVFSLGVLGFVAAILIALLGYYRLEARQDHPVANVKVAGTAEQIARGQKLANLCLSCHSSTAKLPLDGGKGNVISFPPLGTLRSPNLTPGGPLKDWSDGEIMRAIREGVGKNGRPLLGMTSWSFRYLSDDDAQALVAYVRAQPAVARDLPARDLNIVAWLSVGIGLAPTSVQPPVSKPIVAAKTGVSAEYGRYLVALSGCRDCHGRNLNGGSAPLGIALLSPTPLGPSLLVSAQLLDQTGFVSAIKTGVTPRGKTLKADLMPWQDFAGAFSDDDLKAIHAYLRSVDAPAAGEP